MNIFPIICIIRISCSISSFLLFSSYYIYFRCHLKKRSSAACCCFWSIENTLAMKKSFLLRFLPFLCLHINVFLSSFFCMEIAEFVPASTLPDRPFFDADGIIASGVSVASSSSKLLSFVKTLLSISDELWVFNFYLLFKLYYIAHRIIHRRFFCFGLALHTVAAFQKV